MSQLGPLIGSFYITTDEFRAIKEHVAVVTPDGSLVAVTGPAGDEKSIAYAVLFSAAPTLLDALKATAEFIHGGAPIGLGSILADQIRAAIAEAEVKS